MIKHYERYGFTSNAIVDYSIWLMYIAKKNMWNKLQWCLYFFMNNLYFMCDFQHFHHLKKNEKKPDKPV